jgi:hypothetical protein
MRTGVGIGCHPRWRLRLVGAGFIPALLLLRGRKARAYHAWEGEAPIVRRVTKMRIDQRD